MQPVFAEQAPIVELPQELVGSSFQTPEPILKPVPTPAPLPALSTAQRNDEIRMLQSHDPAIRQAATENLIRDGSQTTATKLEFILNRDKNRRHAALMDKSSDPTTLTPEVRMGIANVLMALSIQHAPHLASDDLGNLRRRLALGSALRRPKIRSPSVSSPSRPELLQR